MLAACVPVSLQLQQQYAAPVCWRPRPSSPCHCARTLKLATKSQGSVSRADKSPHEPTSAMPNIQQDKKGHDQLQGSWTVQQERAPAGPPPSAPANQDSIGTRNHANPMNTRPMALLNKRYRALGTSAPHCSNSSSRNQVRNLERVMIWWDGPMSTPQCCTMLSQFTQGQLHGKVIFFALNQVMCARASQSS